MFSIVIISRPNIVRPTPNGRKGDLMTWLSSELLFTRTTVFTLSCLTILNWSLGRRERSTAEPADPDMSADHLLKLHTVSGPKLSASAHLCPPPRGRGAVLPLSPCHIRSASLQLGGSVPVFGPPRCPSFPGFTRRRVCQPTPRYD